MFYDMINQCFSNLKKYIFLNIIIAVHIQINRDQTF